jgi:hypothetical protein
MGKSYFFFKDEPVAPKMASVADVYWDGKPEVDLADDPTTGRPRVFSSRAEKAQYLKEHNIVQVDSRVHGAPLSSINVPQGTKSDSRDEIRKALADVKKMGIDYRRQQYLKIVKEGKR